MHACAGCIRNMLNKIESYSLLSRLRESEEFAGDACVQGIFGDIVSITHYRCELYHT